jgi:AraC-like DNA-binding protein
VSRLDWINDWIDKARRSRYNSARLAELCGVSNSQLRRYFLIRFFRPPREWLDEVRLWHSLEMFVENHSAKFVAATLDFSDTAHLSRQFRKYFGEPPSIYVPRILPSFRKGLNEAHGQLAGEISRWKIVEIRLLSPLKRKSFLRANFGQSDTEQCAPASTNARHVQR